MKREIRETWKIRDKIRYGTSDSEIQRKRLEYKQFGKYIAGVAMMPNSL